MEPDNPALTPDTRTAGCCSDKLMLWDSEASFYLSDHQTISDQLMLCLFCQKCLLPIFGKTVLSLLYVRASTWRELNIKALRLQTLLRKFTRKPDDWLWKAFNFRISVSLFYLCLTWSAFQYDVWFIPNQLKALMMTLMSLHSHDVLILHRKS